jgi:hypothetical protein
MGTLLPPSPMEMFAFGGLLLWFASCAATGAAESAHTINAVVTIKERMAFLLYVPDDAPSNMNTGGTVFMPPGECMAAHNAAAGRWFLSAIALS